MTSKVGKKGKEKKLPGGCKFTDDMTTDQKLEHIEERKEYMLNKKTRKQEIASWGDTNEFSTKMRDFLIEFHLAKQKGGPKFKISTEFKKKMDVPNPNIDDLRKDLAELKEKVVEADGQILEIRTNIADVCEITVDDIDGTLGEEMRKQIAKGPPRVKKGPTYVPPHLLAKGWTTMYTADEGKPYYVHIMRQLSQWDAPDKVKDGDPPTPPGTPDPEVKAIDEGWYVKIKDKDPWEVLVDSRHWTKDIQQGVPSRAQRIKMLLDRMRSDEGQEKATSEVYKAKRDYRHKHPDAEWDEGGCLVYVKPEKEEKKEEQKEPEQADGEGDEGEGDEEEDESSEEDSEEDMIKLCQELDAYKGAKVRDVFDEEILRHMPRKLNAKSAKVKFEFPTGCTPDPTPPGSAKGSGDEDAGEDAGDASASDSADAFD